MSEPNIRITLAILSFRRPLILAACMAASFMAAIEATIIATVMPSIATSLGNFSLFSWVFSAYMLAQAVTIPVYGRLADIYGRRNVFFVGVSLFLLGSALCGCAHSMLQLVAFRAIQGIGAGGVQPLANTIIGDIYTPVERARMQGMLSGVFGFSAIIGPALGAFLVQHGNWPIVFWLNLPIGAVAIIMIALFLPQHVETYPRKVDYQGALLLTLAVNLLMILVTQHTRIDNVTSTVILATFLLATVMLTLHERRLTEPMLPLELWRNRMIATASLGSLVSGTLMMGVTAYLPTYIQGVLGRDADVSAAILATMSVVWVLGSTTAGLWLPRTSYRRIATFGALALIGGAAILIVITPAQGAAWAGIGAALIGAGMGFCNTTFMVSVQTSVAWRQRGVATSSAMFLRFLGQSLGAAIFGALLTAGLPSRMQGGVEAFGRFLDPTWRATLAISDQDNLIHAISSGMHHGYLLTGTLAMLVLLLALTYPSKVGPSSQSHQV